MDRNSITCTAQGNNIVALRKESVDRNIALKRINSSALDVALRKESVDRNRCSYLHSNMSLDVALRKESVDRNTNRLDWAKLWFVSLSARRAWIEIAPPLPPDGIPLVALRKESVDRNLTATAPANTAGGRSPQGERG